MSELAAYGQRQRPVRVAREDQQFAIFVFHVVLRCALTVAVGGDDACVAGAAGFEPANARIKTWCLGPLGDAPAGEAGIGDSGFGICRSKSACRRCRSRIPRSEEHTSELQSIMRISYAVFCL